VIGKRESQEGILLPMEWLLSWGVTSVVVTFLLALGFGFVWATDFNFAKVCFLIAAADAIGGMMMWATKSHKPMWQVGAATFVIIGSVGFLTVSAFRYVDWKRTNASPPQPSKPIETAAPPQVTLRVTNYERFPQVVGEKLKIHLHIRSSGPQTVKAWATCRPVLVTITPGQERYALRKAFEDDLWQKLIADEAVLSKDAVIPIPPQMDYWLPLTSIETLTPEIIRGLQTNQTIYFMGRVRDSASGEILLEYCARTGTDPNTMLFCLDHNGP